MTEQTDLDFLRGDMPLSNESPNGFRSHTQPVVLLTTPSTFVLLEAQRIRSKALQPLQLEREYVAAMTHAVRRLLVVLLFRGASRCGDSPGSGHLQVR